MLLMLHSNCKLHQLVQSKISKDAAPITLTFSTLSMSFRKQEQLFTTSRRGEWRHRT